MFREGPVLVTGGSGFIGTHLVNRLVELGKSVTVLDICDPKNKSVKWFPFDVNDLASLYTWLEKDYSCIFHLAALSSPWECEKDPDGAFRFNVQGTYNLLKAVYNRAWKIIFPSAASLYGSQGYGHPDVDKSGIIHSPIDETHPLDPVKSVYCTTKILGEKLLEEFRQDYGLPYLILRLFNVYGPGQGKDYVIPSFINQAIQRKRIEVLNGKVIRDFVYVDDVVDAMIAGANSMFCCNPLNIGSGVEYSIGEVAEIIACYFNAEITYLDKETFGPTHLCSDNSNANHFIDWEHKTTLTSGLLKTMESFE